MGNVVFKQVEFKSNEKYTYEEQRFFISERRRISVHIFQKNSSGKSKNEKTNYKTNEKVMFFIHGVAGSSYVWWQQIEFFTDLNYTVISIDLLGHGSSYQSKVFEDYEFSKLASDCLAIFDNFHTKSGNNIVIGHSYGCSMATVIAHDRTLLVFRLVLISGGSSKPLGDPDAPFKMAPCCLWCFHPIIISVFRSRAFNGTKHNITDKILSVNIDSWVLKAIIMGQVWDEGNTEYHHKITSPTLLIHGLEDQMVIVEDEWDMLRAIPKCHLKTIPKVGHMSMLKEPDEVNRAILNHIDRDWESISSIKKSQKCPASGSNISNKAPSNISRSFSLFTKKSKVILKSSNSFKDFKENEQEDIGISHRKTCPSSLLVRRKSTRVWLDRANSRRSNISKKTNTVEVPVQDTIVEELPDSITSY